MKIKYTAKEMYGSALPSYAPSRVNHEWSVEDYVEIALRVDVCPENEVQELRSAFGRLVEVLSEKGVLGVSDVTRVVHYAVDTEEADHELVRE